MRNTIKIGFGIVVAVLTSGAVYLLQSSNNPSPTVDVASTPRLKRSQPDSPNSALDVPQPTKAPSRPDYSTGFGELKSTSSTRDQANGIVEAKNVALVRSLRLGKEESERLLDILLNEDAQLREWMRANRRNFVSQEESNRFRPDSDPLVRNLVGDSKFEQYDDYRKHPTERAQVERLSEQLIRNESPPLSQQQDDQLFVVMKEEMNRTPPPQASAYGVHVDYEAALKKWREDNLKRFQQRAASLLTADQLAVMRQMGQ